VPAFQLATIHRAHWYMCVCAGRSCSTVLGVSPIEIHCWCIWSFQSAFPTSLVFFLIPSKFSLTLDTIFLNRDFVFFYLNFFFFTFSQVFFQEWSVNWQFLPEWLFLNKAWSIGLLIFQLFTLYMFCEHKWTDSSGLKGLFAEPGKAHRNKPLDVSP
jgi:hypothetical protein